MAEGLRPAPPRGNRGILSACGRDAASAACGLLFSSGADPGNERMQNSTSGAQQAAERGMIRTTITLDEDLVTELDRSIARANVANRSEAIRDLVRRGTGALPVPGPRRIPSA
jgi:hypothetical protein